VKASFLFDNTADDIYKPLNSEYPKDITRAATDDMPTAMAPPDDINDMDGWQEVYKRTRRYIARYDELANPMGIFRNPEKGKLLPPPCSRPAPTWPT